VRRQADPDGRSPAQPAHRRNLTRRSIADLEATGMVLRLGTTARRTGTGGHRLFAGSPGTRVVSIFDQAAARTGMRDHEAAAARFAPVAVAS
jgi:hypothetical protein